MSASYGQYCPLAMASQLLCNRWTLLVLREMLDGSTGFNDISRGVPLISRGLLSQRLRELADAGIVTHAAADRGSAGGYRLTDAGRALGPVVRELAMWGQEWIDEESSVEAVDVRFLMWDIRRNLRPAPLLPDRFTVCFRFDDAPNGLQEHWLVVARGEVDLCYIDPGHEVNVHLETDLKTMVRVWMGWRDLGAALQDGAIVATGAKPYIVRMRDWLGLSQLARIAKRPEGEQVGRAKV